MICADLMTFFSFCSLFQRMIHVLSFSFLLFLIMMMVTVEQPHSKLLTDLDKAGIEIAFTQSIADETDPELRQIKVGSPSSLLSFATYPLSFFSSSSLNDERIMIRVLSGLPVTFHMSSSKRVDCNEMRERRRRLKWLFTTGEES